MLPTYNRAATLEKAILSVQAQTVEDWELIVVDDGSKDKPEAILETFADGRISLIRHTENRGAPAARNTGMEASRGEFIAFLDSDDEWHPPRLAAQLTAFTERGPAISAMACGVRLITFGGERIGMPILGDDAAERLVHFESGVLHTSAVMIRRSVVDGGVRFDERLPAYQEYDFLLQIARGGLGVAALNEVLVDVRYDDLGHHVSNPAAQVKALELIGGKYLAGMSSRGRSRYHLKLMRANLERGTIGAARAAGRSAFLAHPLALRRWPIFLSSLLGDRAFITVYGLYSRLAPRRWGEQPANEYQGEK